MRMIEVLTSSTLLKRVLDVIRQKLISCNEGMSLFIVTLIGYLM